MVCVVFMYTTVLFCCFSDDNVQSVLVPVNNDLTEVCCGRTIDLIAIHFLRLALFAAAEHAREVLVKIVHVAK